MKTLWKRTLPLVALLLAAAWLLPTAAPAIARAQGDEEQMTECKPERTLHVSGTGQSAAQPDAAVITLGVRTEAEEAGDALKQNSAQMQAVIEAVKAAGVSEKDIQTQTIRLSPRYERPEPRAGQVAPPELVGFTATNIVEVRVREIEGLGELLDAVVTAGGNEIQGIRFEISDRSELYVEAREAAWADAETKAEQLAELAGAELGAVMTISESSRTPTPYVERAMAFSADAASVPVQAGTQTVEISVQVTWVLEDLAE